MSGKLTWIATAGYGLEGVLAREIRALGYETTDVQTSRVTFAGGPEAGVRANLWLRTAGRVRLCVGAFDASDFDQLFEGVRQVRWEDYLPRDAAFPVGCRLVNSHIKSPSDTQAIVKKAVAQRLGSVYRIGRLPESGAERPVEAHIYRDRVTLSIDTSGAPLHRRGYRVLNADAALRETLAAALVLLSRWRPEVPFADPFCGSGTLCVEAAMIGRGIAPGALRTFGAEDWPILPAALWRQAREEARDSVSASVLSIEGADIDAAALSMAQTHARKAGVADSIRFRRADARRFASDVPGGFIVTNPPYGKRLSDRAAVERLYRETSPALRALPGWTVCVLSSHTRLEALLGMKAAHRRALFNGPIACRFYEFTARRSAREGASHARTP